MKSFAVWHDHKDNPDSDSKVEIDLHVNFWKIPLKKSDGFEKFIDIGLRIHNSKCLDVFYIYLPFSIGKENIYDLGKIICNGDANLLNAIFNEQYKLIIDSVSDYHMVTDENNEEVFNIYIIGDENIELKSRFEGTVVKIVMPNDSIKKDKTYMRLRVKTKRLEDLSVIEKNPISIINDAFTRIEIFDFRINSLRHLPNKLNEEISNRAKFNIKKIHFFYICSYKENYILSHTPFSGARRLEDGLWDKYISTNGDQVFLKGETFVAYHWVEKCKQDKEIKDFNVLMKTEFRHNNWDTISKYLLYLITFTIITGLTTNALYDGMKIMINCFQSTERSITSTEEKFEQGDGHE